MKFRIKKFLAVPMLFSMLGGYIHGMENGVPHEGWNLIFSSTLPLDRMYAIIVDKKNCEYFDFWDLFELSKPDLNKKLKFKLSFTLLVKDKAYKGGGSCIRCNAKITNPKENTHKTDESYKFENCNCKLCFYCATSMDDFINYKCGCKNTLENLDKKNISALKAKYQYSKLAYENNCQELLGNNKIENQNLNEAREDYVNAWHEFLKSKKLEISKKKLRQDASKMCLDDFCEVKNLMFSSGMIDSINSAISYSKNAKLDSECPICCSNTSPVCVPQCGHPICLSCLKGLVEKNNCCPICKFRFYRIIVLREKKDGKNLNEFLDNNRYWIQQAIKE